MSEISQEGLKKAKDYHEANLLPGPGVSSVALVDSVRFGPYVEGDFITVLVTEKTYLVSGTETVIATTGGILHPAGTYSYTVPTDVTYVALISSETDAVGAVWKS